MRMCRTIHRSIRRIEGQSRAEYTVVLATVASSCAFLLSDLGARSPSIVGAVTALFS